MAPAGTADGDPVRRIEAAFPFEGTFDALMGVDELRMGPGVVSARLAIRPDHLGLGDVVTGAVYASVAESLASIGTAVAVHDAGLDAAGLSNSTHVTAKVRGGVLRFDARCVSRGADWLWLVRAVDESEGLCAHSTVTVAARPRRSA